MADFQLLSATINIGGSRDHTVVRGPDDPITYPEMLVLQAVHGGIEHVHGAVIVGKTERHHAAERDRLVRLYGPDFVQDVFPGINSPLPAGDDTIPTLEEHTAAINAAEEARSKVRAAKAKPKTVDPAQTPAVNTPATAIPDLTSGKK